MAQTAALASIFYLKPSLGRDISWTVARKVYEQPLLDNYVSTVVVTFGQDKQFEEEYHLQYVRPLDCWLYESEDKFYVSCNVCKRPAIVPKFCRYHDNPGAQNFTTGLGAMIREIPETYGITPEEAFTRHTIFWSKWFDVLPLEVKSEVREYVKDNRDYDYAVHCLNDVIENIHASLHNLDDNFVWAEFGKYIKSGTTTSLLHSICAHHWEVWKCCYVCHKMDQTHLGPCWKDGQPKIVVGNIVEVASKYYVVVKRKKHSYIIESLDGKTQSRHCSLAKVFETKDDIRCIFVRLCIDPDLWASYVIREGMAITFDSSQIFPLALNLLYK